MLLLNWFDLEVVIQRDFTPKELAKYNGLNGEQIYLAIAGKVYDVSSKPEFYGPGSMYENFSGRDASRYRIIRCVSYL